MENPILAKISFLEVKSKCRKPVVLNALAKISFLRSKASVESLLSESSLTSLLLGLETRQQPTKR
jgi:hypothetical protein